MTEKYPTARVELALSDSYYNMLEQIRPCMHLIDNAKKACEAGGRASGLRRRRAGGDGRCAAVVWVCPCPNSGTGAITSTGLRRVYHSRKYGQGRGDHFKYHRAVCGVSR